jgi:mRNA-degrading endonuclease RelE of RelBE toxin-antitoxin system
VPDRPPGPHILGRPGTYRVICRIDDQARMVTVVYIGHRRDVYRT